MTHVDVAGTPAIVAGTPPDLLKEFSAESQKDQGAVRFELLLQDGRLNHFTIVGVWRTREAFETHSAADHTKRFREKYSPCSEAPSTSDCHSLLPAATATNP